jgi:hypothetical protein
MTSMPRKEKVKDRFFRRGKKANCTVIVLHCRPSVRAEKEVWGVKRLSANLVQSISQSTRVMAATYLDARSAWLGEPGYYRSCGTVPTGHVIKSRVLKEINGMGDDSGAYAGCI